MALWNVGCDYCGHDQGTAGYSSPYRYQPEIGSVKLFCSRKCLENYKEKLVHDKTSRRQKEIGEKQMTMQEIRAYERGNSDNIEIERIAREKRRNEFEEGSQAVAKVLNRYAKNKGCLRILLELIVIFIILNVLASNYFNIDGSKLIRFWGLDWLLGR